MLKFFPLHDRVLIKTDKPPEKSEGGILFPEFHLNEKVNRPTSGEIVAIGEGITNLQGHFTPTTLKVGQKVLFPKDCGTSAKELGEDLLIVPESQILAVIEEELV